MRNDINYRGKRVTVEEAKEVITFVNDLLPKLETEFQKRRK